MTAKRHPTCVAHPLPTPPGPNLSGGENVSPYVALLDACRELVEEHDYGNARLMEPDAAAPFGRNPVPDSLGITLARTAIARATFQPLPPIEYPSVAERGVW